MSLPEHNDIQKTKEHWGKEAGTWQVGRGIFWLEHPEVQKRINEKVSGNGNISPYQYLIQFMSDKGYTFPLDRCLTLGCGAGDLEIGLSNYNFCLRHDAVDIADKAIEKAISSAKAKNLNHIYYQVQDVNAISLPENIYDIVFGVGSIHHVAKLEHVFAEVNKSLKPKGIFFLNEYVGPSRFQWTDKQINVMNSILKILPLKYKKVITKPSVIKEICGRPAINDVINVDPSEAIRSGDILPLINKTFNTLEVKKIGGTILHELLSNIAGNFHPNNNTDMLFLETIFKIEDALIEAGEISSDFVVIIAQK